MRLGEFMVAIRAEDFASRTIRRVGTEMAGMSRQQMIAAKRADVAFQKSQALSRKRLAVSNVRDLQTIQRGAQIASRFKDNATKRVQLTEQLAKQEAKLSRLPAARMRQTIYQQQAYNKALQDSIRLRSKLTQLPQPQPIDRRGRAAARNAASAAAQAEIRASKFTRLPSILSGDPRRLLQVSQIAATKAALADLGKEQERLTRRMGRFDNAIAKMSPSLERLSLGLREGGRGVGVFDNAMTKANMRLASAHQALTKAQRAEVAFNQALRDMPLQRLHDVGHALGGIGRTMQLFGAIGTGAFALAANAAANFGQKVTLAATQTRAVGAPITQTVAHTKVLSKALLDLMSQFPASAEEMTKAAYDIYSGMTVSFGGGIKLLKLFNQVAVAGGVSLDAATQGSITILNNFVDVVEKGGKITDQARMAFQRMFAIVRFGRMNFEQFANIMTFVAPAAKGARQSLDDVSGAVAFLTRTLGQAKTGSGLARLIDIFLNPDFQKGMKTAERSITDASGRLLAFPKIINKIASLPIKDANQIIKNITMLGAPGTKGTTGFIQARRSLTQLVTHLAAYQKVQAQTVNDNNEFSASFAAMSDTLGIKWAVFLNQLKVLVLYIGQAALPVFVKIGEKIQEWIKHWENLSESTRNTIVKFAVIVSIGTLLAGVLLSIAGVMVGLIASFGFMKQKIGGMSGALGEAGGASGLLGKLGLLRTLLRGMAAFSAISLTIKAMWGGDLTAIDFIKAALAGGLLGARFGPAGAALGAIVLPVLLKAISDKENRSPIRKAYDTYVKQVREGQNKLKQVLTTPLGLGDFTPGNVELSQILGMNMSRKLDHDITTFKQFVAQKKQIDTAKLKMLGASPTDIAKATSQAQATQAKVSAKKGILAGAEAAKAFITGYVNKFVTSKAFLNSAYAKLYGPDLKRALTSLGIAVNTVQPDKKLDIKKALRSAESFTRYMALSEQLAGNVANQTEQIAFNITRAANAGNLATAAKLINNFVKNSTEKLTSANIISKIMEAANAGDPQAAAALLQQYAQETQQAQQDMVQRSQQLQQTIKDTTASTLQSLRSMYDQMFQENQTAYGQLFHGPWLSSETFDLAKEWGITAGVNDIIKDIDMMTTQFIQRRKMLDTLLKRGLPIDFLDELKTMTPEEALPILQKLVKATPAQTRKLINSLNRGTAEIKKATKIDFHNEIAAFTRAGGKMADGIVNGFKNAGVDIWFNKWIKATFPNVINAAVAQAVKEFNQNNPAVVPGKVSGRNKVVPPHAKPTAGKTTSTNTDNSKTVHVTMPHDARSGRGSGSDRDEQRRTAFMLASKLKSVLAPS